MFNSAPFAKRHSKRHWLTIIYEILICCNGKPVRAPIIYRRANLGYSLFKKLVDGLVSCGFLSEMNVNGKVAYRTSQRGLDFVKKYSDVESLVRPLEVFLGDL